MKKELLFITCLLFSITISSQSFSGKVFYEASSLREIPKLNFDSLNISAEKKLKYKQIFNKMTENKNPIQCFLKFNKNTSIFYQMKQLDLNERENIFLKSNIGLGNFYHDKKKNISIDEKESSGETFLISYPKTQWKITNETKKINGYLCGKAITTKVENSLLRQTSEITAWFAFDLPYNFGPKQFTGLPGLVLELEYAGKYKMRATKIELNSKEKIKIDMPKKGIKISLKKYEEMIARSFKQRQKNYKNKN